MPALTEFIVASAIKFQDVVYVGNPGTNHADLIGHMRQNRIAVDLHAQQANQGFLTSQGRFIGREEALEIAVDAGQVREERLGMKPPTLQAEYLIEEGWLYVLS